MSPHPSKLCFEITFCQEVERLTEQLEEKEREMQQLMSQPQHEREKEVVLLRRSVAEKEQARAASDILCRSLADETHQLRRTLAATAHMCQHLAKCLDERQHAQGDVGEKSADEVGSEDWCGKSRCLSFSNPVQSPRSGVTEPTLFSVRRRSLLTGAIRWKPGRKLSGLPPQLPALSAADLACTWQWHFGFFCH